MNQTVLDQLTSAVVDHFADQPLTPFDPAVVRVVMLPGDHGSPAIEGAPVVPSDPADDLALAIWEDVEWQ